jgi:hypothetical protein
MLLVLSRNNRQVQVLTNSALCIERDFFEFFRSIRAAVPPIIVYLFRYGLLFRDGHHGLLLLLYGD